MDANGHLNWQLIRDNTHVGIHEMTITGKALTQAMYGVAPHYSYFNFQRMFDRRTPGINGSAAVSVGL